MYPRTIEYIVLSSTAGLYSRLFLHSNEVGRGSLSLYVLALGPCSPAYNEPPSCVTCPFQFSMWGFNFLEKEKRTCEKSVVVCVLDYRDGGVDSSYTMHGGRSLYTPLLATTVLPHSPHPTPRPLELMKSAKSTLRDAFLSYYVLRTPWYPAV